MRGGRSARQRGRRWLAAGLWMSGTIAVIVYFQTHTAPPDAGRLVQARADERALLERMGATAAVQLQTCATRPTDMAQVLALRHHAGCDGTSATLLPASARARIEDVLRAAHYSRGGPGNEESWSGGAYSVRVSRDGEPFGAMRYDAVRPLWRRFRAGHRGEILVEIQSSHEDRSCLADVCPGYEGQVEFAGLVKF